MSIAHTQVIMAMEPVTRRPEALIATNPDSESPDEPQSRQELVEAWDRVPFDDVDGAGEAYSG